MQSPCLRSHLGRWWISPNDVAPNTSGPLQLLSASSSGPCRRISLLVLCSSFILPSDCIPQVDLPLDLLCLVLNDFWLSPKGHSYPLRMKIHNPGNPVTPQLTNPLGAKLFYNKVPVLKMRSTPYKSDKTEQHARTNWTKTPSQQASVCPCPIHSKEIDSILNGKSGVQSFCPPPSFWVLFLTPAPVEMSSFLCTSSPTWGLQSSLHTNNHEEFTLIHYQIIFYWEFNYAKIFRVSFSQCV